MKPFKEKILVHPYDLTMLSGDISLSCDEFVYATLGGGSHEGIQLIERLQFKEVAIKEECQKIHEALQSIEILLEED